jgi:hypothetical protein
MFRRHTPTQMDFVPIPLLTILKHTRLFIGSSRRSATAMGLPPCEFLFFRISFASEMERLKLFFSVSNFTSSSQTVPAIFTLSKSSTSLFIRSFNLFFSLSTFRRNISFSYSIRCSVYFAVPNLCFSAAFKQFNSSFILSFMNWLFRVINTSSVDGVANA